MSKRIGNMVVIAEEPDDFCSECNAFEELRPYGKNGAHICWACGQKDPEGTKRRMNAILFGDVPIDPS